MISKTVNSNSPNLICNYLEELAQIFNSFYDSVSVVKTSDKKLKNSRACLVGSFMVVVKRGLGLLNIPVPEKM